jgi:hypothetical protein
MLVGLGPRSSGRVASKTTGSGKPLVARSTLLHRVAVFAVCLKEMTIPANFLLPTPSAAFGKCPNHVGHQTTHHYAQQRR